MSEAKHTPAPWQFKEGCGVELFDAQGFPIFSLDRGHKTLQANATLCKVAPELLEALEALVVLFGHLASDSTQSTWVEESKELIAKAKGAQL